MNEKIIVLKVIKEMMKFQNSLLLDDSKLQVTCIILNIADKWDLLDDYEILTYEQETKIVKEKE